MVKKEKIKCPQCLDTGEFYDGNIDAMIKCDCTGNAVEDLINLDEDFKLPENDFEDGNGY